MTLLAESEARRRRRPTLPEVKRAVIFDGDDTLWLTEHLYDQARDNAREVVAQAGIDGAAWERLARERDVANVARLGHSPERFPTSAVEALEVLDSGASVELQAAVRSAAAGVFTAVAPLRSDTRFVLETLAARGVALALLTKGDREVQERRIEHSGLADLFDEIAIVPSKTPDDFRRVASRLGATPAETLSVGNSLRSDITPSTEAGIDAVWIPAYVWSYERSHDHMSDSTETIRELSEVLDRVIGD